jgi:ABC-2 type transport system ATP-binding protein
MILAENLSKHFDHFLAVNGINLYVPAGQVLALLGPNGAGKTTTVRMLTSVLKPSGGKAQVAGFDVVRQPAEVRARVGVLTEMHGLYDRMIARDYLDFFGQIYRIPASERQSRIQSLFDQFGLQPDAHRRIGEYSKGMRQKLALARCLLHQPPVLLFDEPTSAMDPESARLVRDAIRTLRSEDRAIIVCTHNLAEAESLADQIAIIRNGKIVVQGTSANLKQSMLGPSEYEVRLANSLPGLPQNLPEAVQVTYLGETIFRYRTVQPENTNTAVLKSLLAQGFPVIGLQEVTRSLEQVYLQAINAENQRTYPSTGGDFGG